MYTKNLLGLIEFCELRYFNIFGIFDILSLYKFEILNLSPSH